MENFWKDIKQSKPNCYMLGEWDGKRSDQTLFSTKDGLFFVGVAYEGVIDGGEYFDIYDENGYDCTSVVSRYAEIPQSIQ